MINKEELTHLIGKIGYEILDDIVCPLAGIDSPFANLYLASIDDHTMDENLNERAIKKIQEKYCLDAEFDKMFDGREPLAVIILYILENGIYRNE